MLGREDDESVVVNDECRRRVMLRCLFSSAIPLMSVAI